MAATSGAEDFITRVRYRGRDLRYRRLFDVLGRWCSGDVLDVGGGRLIERLVPRGQPFDAWTVIETSSDLLPEVADPRVVGQVGDGRALDFVSDRFDAVVSIQVLEHVFEPMEMLTELVRVARPGGHIIVMVPQTANLHHLPHHYQNFTRFWLEEAAKRLDLIVEEYHPLGGAWSTIASRLLLQYPAVFGVAGYRLPGVKRSLRFWALAPLALVTSAIGIAVSMVLSLGDLEEEPNNHLVVFTKPSGAR